MYITNKGDHLETPIAVNKWLKSVKETGEYAEVKLAISNRIVAWVNSKSENVDLYLRYNPLVEKVIEDRIISIEEHDNSPKYNKKIFAISNYIAKNIGEIDRYREVILLYKKDKYPKGFEHIILKNGYVIDVTRDENVSSIDGSITTKRFGGKPNELISCHLDGQDTADMTIHYSYNGRFARIAKGAIVDYNDNAVYSYRIAEDTIIDTTKL